MRYFEARAQRRVRNNDALKALADEVIEKDSSIDVYHHHSEPNIESITFIKGEDICSISFHDVPFRWSGPPDFKEFPKEGKRPKDGQLEMPFEVDDIINGFKSITKMRHRHDDYFQSVKEYLDWCSWLIKYKKNEK